MFSPLMFEKEKRNQSGKWSRRLKKGNCDAKSKGVIPKWKNALCWHSKEQYDAMKVKLIGKVAEWEKRISFVLCGWFYSLLRLIIFTFNTFDAIFQLFRVSNDISQMLSTFPLSMHLDSASVMFDFSSIALRFSSFNGNVLCLSALDETKNDIF